VHAAVADDDPDDTTYEHAHGGEVDVCSHAAMALAATVTRPRRRRSGNAWAGQVYRVDLCTHRACRASVARATVLCMYRCVYIRILSTTRSYRSRRDPDRVVARARGSCLTSRFTISSADFRLRRRRGLRGTPDRAGVVPIVGYPIRERTLPRAGQPSTAQRGRHRHPHTASKHVRIGPITIHMGGITMHSQRERHGYSYVSVRRMCNTKGEQEP